MRKAILIFTALVLFVPATSVHAQQVAPFKLTDFWAYLELTYRLDQINNMSTGVETDIDDDRRQVEFGISSTSYIYHPKLLRMAIAGSVLSDRQSIVREQAELPFDSVDLSRSERRDLRVNLNAMLQILKDKRYPATITYTRENPIVSTGVEGSFTQETERLGFDLRLRDILPFDLVLNASDNSSFGESLDRVVDNSMERVSVAAKKTFSTRNQMGLDYETSVQESRNGDPRRLIQETVRETERILMTTNSKLGSEDQLRIDQILRWNRRDQPEVNDITFSPVVRWEHNSKWDSVYRYDFSQTERPESDLENRREALSASLRFSPSERFSGVIASDFERSDEVDRLSQTAGGFSGRANIKRAMPVGQLNLSLGLGYRLDDRVSQSPRILIEEEPVTFDATAPIPLSRDFVVAGTVVVRNNTGTQTFIEGVDYLVSEIGSITRIERLINGSILDGETVLVDYEAETGGTFEFSRIDQFVSANLKFARFHDIFFRYSNSRQDLQSGSPAIPFNSVESFEIGLREEIPIRTRGVQLSGEVRYRRQEEDINPYDQASLSLSIQAPLSSKANLTASASRGFVDNFLSDEDSDMTAFNANITWQPLRNLTIRTEGHYDKDSGGTVFRSNMRWQLAAHWRYRKISMRIDNRYNRQRQGDLDNDYYELWVQIRREMF